MMLFFDHDLLAAQPIFPQQNADPYGDGSKFKPQKARRDHKFQDSWLLASISGWWLSPTPLKNDGVHQLGLLFPTYGKIQNVPNHQSDIIVWVPNFDLYPYRLNTSQIPATPCHRGRHVFRVGSLWEPHRSQPTWLRLELLLDDSWAKNCQSFDRSVH